MSVFFLYPVYLLGLVAAAVPLVIHLLNRRRVTRVRFPAVRFVLLSQRRISRSYRLRHWLLLALRTFAVILLALLLANPVFQIGPGLFASGGPIALVIILDNSLSMAWSGDGNGFQDAKRAAATLIAALGDGDRAAVIPSVFPSRDGARLKSERDVLLRDVEAIDLSDGSADFNAALGRAYELLDGPAGQKEIHLITDLGLTGWDRFTTSALTHYDLSVPVRVIRVGRKGRPFNAAAREIRVAGQGVGVDLPLHLEAVIANFGAQAIPDLLVQLIIEGRQVEQKLTTLPPAADSVVAFQTALKRPGAHAAQLVIKKDGLAGQTIAHFVLTAQDKIRVLLVDGDPQTSLVQSETFFISRALNPGGDGESSIFLPTSIVADGLETASLEGYQVVVLTNVGSLPERFLERLRAFLKEGGGALIFAGERVPRDHYNLKLAQSEPAILPAQITGRQTGPEANAARIEKVKPAHPALKAFADPVLLDSIRSTRVWGYARLRPSATPLLELENGDPLVVEQRVGAGRAVFVATTADRDWTDLPLKTAYLPLIHSLVDYLAGGKRGFLDPGIAVGERKAIALPPTAVGKTVRVIKPDKQEGTASAVPDRDRAVAAYEDNDRAGIYRVVLPPSREKEPREPELYAVNSPFLESRLEEIDEKELQARLSPIRVQVVPIESLERGGMRMDLALPVLGLLIATLLLEGWIAQRI